MSKPYVFYISGMSCVSCSNGIESFLKTSDSIEIQSFHVDFTTADPKKTTIILNEIEHSGENDHQTRWLKLHALIEEIGYQCESYEYPTAKEQPAPETPNSKTELTSNKSDDTLDYIITMGKKILTSHWFLGALGCITGIGLLVLSLTLGALPLIAMIPIAGLSVLLTLALGARSYHEAWKKLVNAQTLTMDTLFAVSTISVLVVSLTSFFIPWLPMMFEAGLLIYGFRHIGIAIEETIKEKISSAQFQDRAPRQVKLLTPQGIKDAPLEQIKPDDILIIHPGDLIPLDGYCDNDSIIYNTIITGAILPRHFRSGEKVLAGMRLAEDAPTLRLRVLRPTKQSYLARLDEGISQSINEKAPLEIKTGQLLSYFIPAVITLAVASGIIIGLFFPAAIAIQCAISVLVSACPCTLGLIIPLAVKTGIHKAAEHGVQFKNSKVLQEAEQIDTIVFDLNGTLTTGVPVVKHYSVFDNSGYSPDQFLSICSALEEQSVHPVGKSIHYFSRQNSSHKIAVSKPNDSHHSGIFGSINGKDYTIGSRSLMNAIDISTSSVEGNLELAAGDSLVFLAEETKLIGYIIITDPLRKDAIKTIKTLTDMGKEIHLCTGADEKTAQRYAAALGINKIYANSVPTERKHGDRSKPAYIKWLKSKGHKVAMVGDAGNDALALAASDLGIAVLSQDSDELTQQNAGAIIHSGNLLPIISTFAISEQTVSNIKQNLVFSLGYNLAAVLVAGGLLIAIGITLNPAVGVALMAIQASLILLNVYRFKEQSLEHVQNDAKEEALPAEEPNSSHERIKKHTPTMQAKSSCETIIPSTDVPGSAPLKKAMGSALNHFFSANSEQMPQEREQENHELRCAYQREL